jgi:hypothetical protein
MGWFDFLALFPVSPFLMQSVHASMLARFAVYVDSANPGKSHRPERAPKNNYRMYHSYSEAYPSMTLGANRSFSLVARPSIPQDECDPTSMSLLSGG